MFVIVEGQTVATINDPARLGGYSGQVGVVREARRVTPPETDPARYEFGVDLSGHGDNVTAWFVETELLPLRVSATALRERRRRL